MSDDNVVPFPRGAKPGAAVSIEVERVKRELRALRRRDDDVFRHLARKVHGYLLEVEKKGQRTGHIGRIIGGHKYPSAKDRIRFTWDGENDRDFKANPLNKTGPRWLEVIDRCAKVLGRSEDDLLLDAVAGSRLRPASGPSEYSEGSWLAEFHVLMEALQARLRAHKDCDGLFAYLIRSHLNFDAERNLSREDEPILAWFRADFPEWPEVFGQVPHVPVCDDLAGGFKSSIAMSEMADQRHVWKELLDSCFPDHVEMVVEAYLVPRIRYGIALVPDMECNPALAFFKWPCVGFSSAYDPASVLYADNVDPFTGLAHGPAIELRHPSHLELASALLRPWIADFSEELIGRVSFAPLGTKAFDEIAATSFEDFWGRVGGEENRCWDPFQDSKSDEIEYASGAPDMTVVAMIERNLLFADRAGKAEQRIDRILENDIEQMAGAIREHRAMTSAIVDPARRALMESWSKDRS